VQSLNECEWTKRAWVEEVFLADEQPFIPGLLMVFADGTSKHDRFSATPALRIAPLRAQYYIDNPF
jgi:hypothetical protein